MSSSTSSTSSLDHLLPSEQLCYVHCKICDTILAVSVPCTSVFKTVTVRCGHCTNLLPVNMSMGGLLFPSMNLPHNFFPHNNLEDGLNLPCSDMLMNHTITNDFMTRGDHLDHFIPISPPLVNKPPEKRQRVPSAYNRFVKEEIQRIKAGNPDISHREAFGAAAKNWAHFPHIHFGLMPDSHAVKKTNLLQQEGENVMIKDGFFGSANVGVSPY